MWPLTGRYDKALERSARAVGVHTGFVGAADLVEAHCQVLLQQALAEHPGVGALTRGMIAFHEAGLLARSLPAWAHRYEETLAATEAVVAQLLPDDSPIGQVLLERAEVLDDMGDVEGVAAALADLRARYQDEAAMESLRGHLHVGSTMLARYAVLEVAAGHLYEVLRRAAKPGQLDLTRTMLALHDLTRLPDALVPRADAARDQPSRAGGDRPPARFARRGGVAVVHPRRERADLRGRRRPAPRGRPDLLPHAPSTRDCVSLLEVAEIVFTPSVRTSCLLHQRRRRAIGVGAVSLLDGHCLATRSSASR